MLCDQMYQILEQLLFKLHGGNDQVSDLPAHLVRLLQCWATGDIADFVYAASEHRAGQCAAWEAVDPAWTAFSVPSKVSAASSAAVASR